MLAWIHWLLASGTTCACTVDDVDAKCVDMGALVGRATRTANVIIRPMGPIVSLSLPRSSRPTKRRAGLFKSAIMKSNRRWYEIADLNNERYLYLLLHERDDVLWLTISDSCSLAVYRMTRGTGIIPGTIEGGVVLPKA